MPSIAVPERKITGLLKTPRAQLASWMPPPAAATTATATADKNKNKNKPTQQQVQQQQQQRRQQQQFAEFSEVPYFQDAICDSYEWMWYAGFSGLDPLADCPPSPSPSSSSSSSSFNDSRRKSSTTTTDPNLPASYSSSMPSTGGGSSASSASSSDLYDIYSGAGAGFFDKGEVDFALREQTLSAKKKKEAHSSASSTSSSSSSSLPSPPSPPSPPSSSGSTSASRGVGGGGGGGGGGRGGGGNASPPSKAVPPHDQVYRRADAALPLSWIDHHIGELEAFASELDAVLSQLHGLNSDGQSFRCSASKKDPEVQPVPLNLHAQIVAVRPHGRAANQINVIDSITCGSLSPHGLGMKKGKSCFGHCKPQQ